jgi:hypothetical protein
MITSVMNLIPTGIRAPKKDAERIKVLEKRVADLEVELEALKRRARKEDSILRKDTIR